MADKGQADKTHMDMDAVRDYIKEERKAQADAQRKAEEKEKKRTRSKSNPGDPLILKFDKWLDKFRW